MAQTAATTIIRKEEQLRGSEARSNFENLWRDVTQLVLPHQRGFTEQIAPGVERTSRILDSTAGNALELFGSFMLVNMANPAVDWMGSRVQYADDRPEVPRSAQRKQFDEQITKLTLNELKRPEVGFYSALHVAFLTDGSLGTDVLSIDWHEDRLLVQNVPVREIVIEEDLNGRPACYIRKRTVPITKAAVHPRWAEYFQREYSSHELTQDKECELLHYVARVDALNRQWLPPAARNFKWASVWVDKTKNKVMWAGGDDTALYVATRWMKAIEDGPYGRSPAITALPDIRLVNAISDTVLRSAEKQTDPPLLMRQGMLLSPLRVGPSTISFTDGDPRAELLIPPGGARVEVGELVLQKRQEAIRTAFFTPLFLSPETPVKTATEILLQADERNKAVAPMVIRQQNERFAAMMPRVYQLLMRHNRLPPLPEDATGIETEYNSPVSSSQQVSEALGAQRLLEGVGLLAQFDQNAADTIDVDRTAEVMHAGSGAPARVLTTETEKKARRKARAEQVEAQRTQEAALNAAQVSGELAAARS